MPFNLSPRRQIVQSVYALFGGASSSEDVNGDSRIGAAKRVPGQKTNASLRNAATANDSGKDAERGIDGGIKRRSESDCGKSEGLDASKVQKTSNTDLATFDASLGANDTNTGSGTDLGANNTKLGANVSKTADLGANDTTLGAETNASKTNLTDAQEKDAKTTLNDTTPNNSDSRWPKLCLENTLIVFEFNFSDLAPAHSPHILFASSDLRAVSVAIDTTGECLSDSISVPSFTFNNEPVILFKSIEDIVGLIRGRQLGAQILAKVRGLARQTPEVLTVPAEQTDLVSAASKYLQPSNLKRFGVQVVRLDDAGDLLHTMLSHSEATVFLTT